ncbi:MAG: hypothetical protein ACJAVM_001907 [Sulfitobacter sp.]|jgi:hypothetical protein
MLNIYAAAFLTATRNDTVALRDYPTAAKAGQRRWFQRRKTIHVDPNTL